MDGFELKPGSFLRVRQVAAALGVSAQLVRLWIRTGKLEYCRIDGGTILIPKSAIIKRLNDGYVPERGQNGAKS